MVSEMEPAVVEQDVTHASAVLGVCVNPPLARGICGQFTFTRVGLGARALDALGMFGYDLVVVGQRLPDMRLVDMIRRMRVAWPWQKWALVAPSLLAQQEIAARELGVVAIFPQMPDTQELLEVCSRLRRGGLRIPTAVARPVKKPWRQIPQSVA